MQPWRRQAAITLAGSGSQTYSWPSRPWPSPPPSSIANGSEYAWTITWVEPSGPAEKAGIRPGDRLGAGAEPGPPNPYRVEATDRQLSRGGKHRQHRNAAGRRHPGLPGETRNRNLENRHRAATAGMAPGGARDEPTGHRNENDHHGKRRIPEQSEIYSAKGLWNQESRGELVSGPAMGPYQIGHTMERHRPAGMAGNPGHPEPRISGDQPYCRCRPRTDTG